MLIAASQIVRKGMIHGFVKIVTTCYAHHTTDDREIGRWMDKGKGKDTIKIGLELR